MCPEQQIEKSSIRNNNIAKNIGLKERERMSSAPHPQQSSSSSNSISSNVDESSGGNAVPTIQPSSSSNTSLSFDLPRTNITRIVKNVLPADIAISMDAKTAFGKAAGKSSIDGHLFISFVHKHRRHLLSFHGSGVHHVLDRNGTGTRKSAVQIHTHRRRCHCCAGRPRPIAIQAHTE